MTEGRKVKVSLTIAYDLLRLVDRTASRAGETRSGVVDKWLRGAARAAIERDLDEATARYYDELSTVDRREDRAIASAAAAAARGLAIDEPVRRRRRTAKRKRR